MLPRNVATIALGIMVVAALAVGQDKQPAVQELDIKGLRRDFPQGMAAKPTLIASGEDLAKAFPEKDVQDRLKKAVDFGKQKLLFFAWSGSGQDKLTFQVKDGEKAPEVVFQYQRGLTRDLRGHMHLFAIPKDATWRVEGK